MDDLNKINNTIDNLLLDYLTLIEENITENVNLENAIKDGNFHLAKTRYVMGHRNVSAIQLPNEDSTEILASATVNRIVSDKNDTPPVLELDIKKSTDTSNEEYTDPIKWFGILVPQNLRYAQTKFQQACLNAVNCVNLKLQINDLTDKLLFLLNVKDNLNTLKE